MPLFKDPYLDTPAETRIRIQGDIDPNDFRYLFRKVLGVRGCQEPIIATLIKALVIEVKKPKYGIIDSYDDDNFGKIQSIIERVNFNPIGVHANRGEWDAVAQIYLNETKGQQDLARRTDHRTTGGSRPSDEPRRKTKTHPSHSDSSHVATDTSRKVGGRKRSSGKETTEDQTKT